MCFPQAAEPSKGVEDKYCLSAAVKTDLPIGSYYVKELATDAHYILDDTEYPVMFSYAGQDTALVEIAVNGGEAIENDLIYGSISGMKTDENGKALSGALIGLFRSEETDFTAETALLTATSAEDGSFSFESVPYGTWIVREIEPPVGYVLNDTAYEVNIGSDGQVVEITLMLPALRRMWTTCSRATRQEPCWQTRSSSLCSIRHLLTVWSLPSY